MAEESDTGARDEVEGAPALRRARAQLRATQVHQYSNVLPFSFRDIANEADRGDVRRHRAVARIQSHDIEPGAKHCRDGFGAAAGGAQGRDDLGAAVHRFGEPTGTALRTATRGPR